MATEQDIKDWLNNPASGPSVYGRNWANLCQALMYQICKRFGSAPVVYQTAAAARAASIIIGHNPADASPGDFHHWDFGKADHIALSLGGNRALMASSFVPSTFANHVGVMTVEEYSRASGATYLGYSNSDGWNDAAIGLQPTQRQVGVANSRRRIAPEKDAPIGATPLPAASVHDVEVYTDGDLYLGFPWFRIGGLWSHSSTFTDQGTHDLTQLEVTAPAESGTPVEIPVDEPAEAPAEIPPVVDAPVEVPPVVDAPTEIPPVVPPVDPPAEAPPASTTPATKPRPWWVPLIITIGAIIAALLGKAGGVY